MKFRGPVTNSGPADMLPHERLHEELMPEKVVFLMLFAGFIIFGGVSYSNSWLPKPLKFSDAETHPGEFIAEFAYYQLKELSAIGPKPTGSYENEVLAAQFIHREIEYIIQRASIVNFIEVDIQKPTGSYYLDFKPYGFVNSYTEVQNIIVKISSADSMPSSVLINCHFDSVPLSPGFSWIYNTTYLGKNCECIYQFGSLWIWWKGNSISDWTKSSVACDGEEAKSVWEKIRNNHRDALWRQRTAVKSGAAGIPIKHWRYQNMEFLLKYMGNRPHGTNLDSDDVEPQQAIQYVETDDNATTENHNRDCVLQNEEDVNASTEIRECVQHSEGSKNHGMSEESPSSFSDCTPKPQRKKMKKDNLSSLIEQSILERDRRAKERAVERKILDERNPKNDELYNFYMSMYGITKNMSPVSQLLVRMKVFQAVSQEEARLLNLAQPMPHNTFHQPHLEPSHNQDSYMRANASSPASTSSNQETSSNQSASNIHDNTDSSTSFGNSNNLINYINNFSD